MSFVQTFRNVLAPVRSDGQPWVNVIVQEAATSTGSWTTIATKTWTDADPATAEPTTITVTTAALENGWYRLYWTDAGGAASPHTAPVYADSVSSSGWLITVDELKTFLGVDPTDTRNDAKYAALIGPVSETIRAYTERDFGLGVAVEERTFLYDGSGFLDIDDATAVTSVVFTYPYGAPSITLDPELYVLRDSPVYTYIAIPPFTGGAISPEMGFNQNLDVLVHERGYYSVPKTARVTGTWGWATVPDDVKMAAAWVAQAWATRPTSAGLSMESIEGWTRAWGQRGGASAAALAIPEAVRDILSSYARIDV